MISRVRVTRFVSHVGYKTIFLPFLKDGNNTVVFDPLACRFLLDI
jgi:hypothetical protein